MLPWPVVYVHIQRVRVFFEPHTNKKSLTQCKKCQTWRHATQNCYLGVQRCVKCAQNHLIYPCEKSKTLPVKCANCGEDRPASSTQCKVYLSKIDKLQANRERASVLRATIRESPDTYQRKAGWCTHVGKIIGVNYTVSYKRKFHIYKATWTQFRLAYSG